MKDIQMYQERIYLHSNIFKLILGIYKAKIYEYEKFTF